MRYTTALRTTCLLRATRRHTLHDTFTQRGRVALRIRQRRVSRCVVRFVLHVVSRVTITHRIVLLGRQL